MAAPRHVLLELDEQGDLHSVGEESDAEEPRGDARRETPESRPESPDGPPGPDRSDDGAQFIASRFWGVSWHRRDKKWRARYTDANGKDHNIAYCDDEEEAARAVNKAISDAGLQGKRHMNAVDANGALVPRKREWRDRSAVVVPDLARRARARLRPRRLLGRGRPLQGRAPHVHDASEGAGAARPLPPLLVPRRGRAAAGVAAQVGLLGPRPSAQGR